MKRFFIGSKDIVDGQATVRGSDVRHIRDVLRLNAGQEITLIDESASEHLARIISIEKDAVIAQILRTAAPKPPAISLTLFQSLPKGAKFDLVVEKATELGADGINAFITERTVPKPDVDGAGRRLRRWRRLAEAAAKQCRRPTVPLIGPLRRWEEAAQELRSFDLIVVFWEGASDFVDKALDGFTGKNLALVIGPEGGFAAGEIEALKGLGAKTASLGPRILRAETAPIAAIAVVNHVLNR